MACRAPSEREEHLVLQAGDVRKELNVAGAFLEVEVQGLALAVTNQARQAVRIVEVAELHLYTPR